MKQTTDTRSEAISWYYNLLTSKQRELHEKYNTHNIETIYLSEHPQTTEPIKEDTTNTVTDGEFMLLLNEGEDDESKISLAGYIKCFDEDLEADFMGVVNLLVGQSYQYGADHIKRIS